MFPNQYMMRALDIALSVDNEVPVGAVIVGPTGIIAESCNTVEANCNPMHHAEYNAINEALRRLGSKYLDNHDMYVTLEPCPFCAAAISMTRIRTLYFGAWDEKSGGVVHGPRIFSYSHHKPIVYDGILEREAASILKRFFALKRKYK